MGIEFTTSVMQFSYITNNQAIVGYVTKLHINVYVWFVDSVLYILDNTFKSIEYVVWLAVGGGVWNM